MAEDLLSGGSASEASSEACPVNGSEHQHGSPCKVLTSGVQKSNPVQILEFKNINLPFSSSDLFLDKLLHFVALSPDKYNRLTSSNKIPKLLLAALKLAPNAPPVSI